MRGALHSRMPAHSRTGIIPARAGSTSSSRTGACRPRDHPRSCGEHPDADAVCAALIGSSPLVRGAPIIALTHHVKLRIIPARAGSTEKLALYIVSHQDHPRSCGEHSPPSSGRPPWPGSSPLVRGALHIVNRVDAGPGIIPARAGSTLSGSTCYQCSRDHPRSCGEHSYPMPPAFTAAGSSPLVRGAHAVNLEMDVFTGIIPARAGSTQSSSRQS